MELSPNHFVIKKLEHPVHNRYFLAIKVPFLRPFIEPNETIANYLKKKKITAGPN